MIFDKIRISTEIGIMTFRYFGILKTGLVMVQVFVSPGIMIPEQSADNIDSGSNISMICGTIVGVSSSFTFTIFSSTPLPCYTNVITFLLFINCNCY